MNAIELIGDVDEEHRLHVQVPTDVPAGQVRVIVFVPEEDEAGNLWPNGVAREWASELTVHRIESPSPDRRQPGSRYG